MSNNKNTAVKDLTVYKVLSKSSEKKGSIVLLHGYGANGRDLMGLATYPKLSALDLDWYFIEAPLSPPELAAFGGRAWFNLSMQNFMQSMSSNDFSGFYKLKSKEFENSLESLKQTIWNLNLNPEDSNFIGGFSQGAMVSAHLLFDDLNTWSAGIMMSGAPFQYMNWKKNNSSQDKKVSVFQSHGYNDPVLPMKCGEDFLNEMKCNNTKVTTSWFQGGHEIPMTALNELAQFLSKTV